MKSIRFFAVKRPRISLLSAEIIVRQTKNSGIHRKRDTIMSKTPKNNLAIIIRPFFYIKNKMNCLWHELKYIKFHELSLATHELHFVHNKGNSIHRAKREFMVERQFMTTTVVNSLKITGICIVQANHILQINIYNNFKYKWRFYFG